MKIRIMGSPDLIEAWAAELKKAYGVTGRIYPCRGSSEVRLYVDLDDRKAAEIVGLKPCFLDDKEPLEPPTRITRPK